MTCTSFYRCAKKWADLSHRYPCHLSISIHRIIKSFYHDLFGAKLETCLPFPAFLIRDHDDVIKWKKFPRHWPFVWGFHWSPVNSPHKGQWHGALMFSLICAWTNGWANNRDAGDLRCHHAHYDITVMELSCWNRSSWKTKTYLLYMVNIMAAADLVTLGAKVSAALVLS